MNIADILKKVTKGDALTDEETKFLKEYKEPTGSIPLERLNREIDAKKEVETKLAQAEKEKKEAFKLLVIAALLSDQLLHYFDLVWLGRLLGIPGTILILLSLLYSLRKRKIITFGNPKTLLNLHETLTWMGALLVLVHAGIHFNTILPWLAMIGLIINVLSGLVGQRLFCKSDTQVSCNLRKTKI